MPRVHGAALETHAWGEMPHRHRASSDSRFADEAGDNLFKGIARYRSIPQVSILKKAVIERRELYISTPGHSGSLQWLLQQETAVLSYYQHIFSLSPRNLTCFATDYYTAEHVKASNPRARLGVAPRLIKTNLVTSITSDFLALRENSWSN